MRLNIVIDDEDKDEPGAENTPFTLWLYEGDETEEFVQFIHEDAIIGNDIPTMLREAAEKWPRGVEVGGAA